MKCFSLKKELKVFYKELISKLNERGVGYSGLAQRKLADNPDLVIEWINKNNFKKVVFIGLDALTKSQEIIIDFLLKNKICDIYWDTDNYFLHDSKQESAKFLRKYQKKWPNLFTNIQNDFLTSSKDINLFGVSKNISQAKFLGNLLLDKKYNTDNIKRVAIILPNENLLISVLESLPLHISDINVTTSPFTKP